MSIKLNRGFGPTIITLLVVAFLAIASATPTWAQEPGSDPTPKGAPSGSTPALDLPSAGSEAGGISDGEMLRWLRDHRSAVEAPRPAPRGWPRGGDADDHYSRLRIEAQCRKFGLTASKTEDGKFEVKLDGNGRKAATLKRAVEHLLASGLGEIGSEGQFICSYGTQASDVANSMSLLGDETAKVAGGNAAAIADLKAGLGQVERKADNNANRLDQVEENQGEILGILRHEDTGLAAAHQGLGRHFWWLVILTVVAFLPLLSRIRLPKRKPAPAGGGGGPAKKGAPAKGGPPAKAPAPGKGPPAPPAGGGGP